MFKGQLRGQRGGTRRNKLGGGRKRAQGGRNPDHHIMVTHTHDEKLLKSFKLGSKIKKIQKT